MLRATFMLTPPHPVHLPQTLGQMARGHYDPLFRITRSQGHTKIWTTATADGSDVLLSFDRLPENIYNLHERLMRPIRVRLWSESAQALQTIGTSVHRWLGFEDDWSAFTEHPAFQKLPASLVVVHRENPGVRIPSTGQLTRHAITAIAEQRVTGIEAMGGLRAIIKRYGNDAPRSDDPDQPKDLKVFPDASVWASLPSWVWHTSGFDGARSRAIVEYAQRADSLEHLLRTHNVAAVARALNAVPGIGPWTIAETLQQTVGHPDAISVGDYHLAHTVGYALTGRRTNDAGMIELLRPWAGHRHRVVTLIKVARIQEPRKAARLAPQDHRFH